MWKMVPEARVFEEGEAVLYENLDVVEESKITICLQ
jgi:hypothetical protein